MHQELARKRLAVVVNAAPAHVTHLTNAGTVTIRSVSRGQLAAEATRQWQAGRIERAYRTGRTVDGTWIAYCTAAPHRSWLVRHRVGLGVVLGALIFAAVAAWFLVRALVAVAPLALGIVALLVLASVLGGGTTIIQKVTINR